MYIINKAHQSQTSDYEEKITQKITEKVMSNTLSSCKCRKIEIMIIEIRTK